MSKELTPDEIKQIYQEAADYVGENFIDDDTRIESMRRGYVGGRSKSITEIQELREEIAFKITERESLLKDNQRLKDLISHSELHEMRTDRGKEVQDLKRQIVDLKNQAKRDFARINELEDFLVAHNLYH